MRKLAVNIKPSCSVTHSAGIRVKHMALSQKIAQTLLELSPSAVVTLYQLFYDTLNEPTQFFPFTSSTNSVDGPIVFGGISYRPIPAEIDPTETNIQQRISRPTARISNIGGQISSLLRQKEEFRNAKLVIIKTFVKFLDAANFDSGVNPFGAPDPNAELSRETFIISQKRGENKEIVEFELTYPFDLSDFNVAGKTILGNYCPFQYRGKGCNYCGPPIEKIDGSSFSVAFDGNYNVIDSSNLWIPDYNYSAGNAVYVENKKNPPKTVFVCKLSHISTPNNHPNKPEGSTYWEKDDCGKEIPNCKKRFTDDVNNPCYKGYLPWGGYAGTNRYKF